MIALLALLACGDGGVGPAEGPLTVRAHTLDVSGQGGTLVVQTAYEQSLSLDLPDPTAVGLTFSPEGEPVVERLGDRRVVTQRWRFTGKKGSYEIQALTVTAGENTATSTPIWVDLGVEAPVVGELADIVEPEPAWDIPWKLMAGLAAAVGVLGGMVVVAFVGLARPRVREKVKLPADVRCLKAWEKVRNDPELSNDDRARELSRLFREYTEEVLNFPAASWTTTEILAHLDQMYHLPDGNLPRAKNLLRATDLVKYAEVKPGEDFFEGLDADLRAFVRSTRPSSITPERKGD